MSKQFSSEQIQWLKDNYFCFEYIRILTDVYNTTFNEQRSVDTIKHKCRMLGLQKGRQYTEEMDRWLIDNIDNYSRKELVKAFNDEFHQRRTEDCLKAHCNRELKIYFKDNEDRYTKARSRVQQFPIGAETIRNGYVWVKVADDCYKATDYAGYKNWKPKHQIVWEQQYGEIPEDKMIVFLNQDKLDCSLENLYAISKSANAIMIKNKWYTHSREHTLTAIKWCELHCIAK